MQFPWLDELTKQGHISAADRDTIYAECGALTKIASDAPNPEQMKRFNSVMAIPMGLIGMTIPIMLNRFINARSDASRMSKELEATAREILQNKAKLLADPDYARHKEKVEARFNEIAGLAPTVARNHNLMSALMKEKLHSGLTSEDVNSLALIQASYTPSYGFQKKITKEASLVALGNTAADMLLTCAETGLVKQAAPGKLTFGSGMGKVLSNVLMATAGSVLLGLGRGVVDTAADAWGRKEREKKLRSSFAEAMAHPDADILRDQPEKARQAFQTLTHFSPNVALQPVAARSFMKKLVDYKGDVHSGDLKDLTEIEKNMRGAAPAPFLKSLREGADAAGFKDSLKSGLSPFTAPYSKQLEQEFMTHLGLRQPLKDQAKSGG